MNHHFARFLLLHFISLFAWAYPSDAQVDYQWIPVNEGLEGDTVPVLWTGTSGVFFAGGIGGLFRSDGFKEPWRQTTLLGFDVGAFHEAGSGKLFAGTREGLFTSTDDGRTWSATRIFYEVYDIEESDSGTLFLGTSEGVLKNNPGEETWEIIGQWQFDVACAANASQPVTPVCFLEIAENETVWIAVGARIFYTDDSVNWACLSFFNDGACRDFPGVIKSLHVAENDVLFSLSNGLYRYDNTTELIQPLSIYSEVYSSAASENAHYIVTRGSASAGGEFPNALYRSEDKGINWTFEGQNDIGIVSVVVDPDESWICLGEVEGIRCSENGGSTWFKWNEGLTNAKVLSLFTTHGDDIIAGTIGGAFVYDRSSSTWNRLDINRGVGDLKIPIGRISQSESGDIFAFGGGIHRSPDGGRSWERASFDVVFADKKEPTISPSRGSSIVQVTPSQLLPYKKGCPFLESQQASMISWGDTLAYVSSGAFVRSEDRWETATFFRSIGSFGDKNLQALTRASDGRLLVGGQHDVVLSSRDGGRSWSRAALSGKPDLTIQELALLPDEKILAATSDHLYISFDSGLNWRRNGTAHGCINTIKTNGTGVAIADGRFVTTDSGVVWNEITPPPAQALSITFDADGIPYIGTYGLGVFKGSRPLHTHIDPPMPTHPRRAEIYPNPIRDEAWLKLLIDDDQRVIVELYDALSRKHKTMSYYVKRGENIVQVNLSTLPSGQYFLVIHTRHERLHTQLSLID